MKFYAFPYRTIAKQTLFAVVVLAILLLIIRGILGGVPHLEVGVEVFVTVCVAILVIPTWRTPGQCWVRVDTQHVTWRTNKIGLASGCSSAGSVATGEVSGVSVVLQDRVARPGKMLSTKARGHVVRLALVNGGEVVLPLFSSPVLPNPILIELLGALRTYCASSVPVETSIPAS